MNYITDITDLIGKTPLLRLGSFAPEVAIYAKCEFMNPLSLKDRPVLQIIQDAEANGEIITLLPIVTFPMTAARGWTKEDLSIFGSCSLAEKLVVTFLWIIRNSFYPFDAV